MNISCYMEYKAFGPSLIYNTVLEYVFLRIYSIFILRGWKSMKPFAVSARFLRINSKIKHFVIDLWHFQSFSTWSDFLFLQTHIITTKSAWENDGYLSGFFSFFFTPGIFYCIIVRDKSDFCNTMKGHFAIPSIFSLWSHFVRMCPLWERPSTVLK